MEKWIDLYTHTSHSDGIYTPSELVRYAKEKGLAAIAVTDHGCVTGVYEAIEAGKEVGVEVISGVELSARYADKAIHMLGLYINHHNKDIIEVTIAARKDKNERYKQILNKLMQIGFNDLSYEELQSINKMQIITRSCLCKYLILKGIVGSESEAREKYLDEGKAAYVESPQRILSIPEAISLIHNAGGIAIWAHPILCQFELCELA